ncbi:MAG: exosortase-associated EpsI family protein, partial [Chthoniobacterales bacterium]|nr:exosortase-associated EpsI family protein [Chthoniobacterales bacterium]
QAQELLRYNEGGGGSWSGTSGDQWAMYFFKWLPGRTAGLFIKNHRPDICLPASGMTLRGGVNHKVITVNGVGLPVRSYVFESGRVLLHVYYFYWDGSAPEVTAKDQENWTAAGRLEAVRRGKRDVGTQMLELVAFGYDTQEAADAAAREQLARIIHRG